MEPTCGSMRECARPHRAAAPSLMTPGPGRSGYALDFMNRDGSLSIQKKVAGDIRDRWSEGALSYSNGGTYYSLATTEWMP